MSTSTSPCSSNNKKKDSENVNGSVLSDDLLLNILFRLQVKYLFRFKCVSKAWKRMISDAFARLKLSVRMSGLFYHGTAGRYGYVHVWNETECMGTSLSFLPCHPNLRIVDCCNGLILCIPIRSQQRMIQGEMANNSFYYVCNPATKKWVTLLVSPSRMGCPANASILFNPIISPHYKVVRLLDRSNFQSLEFDVFSSETGAWAECIVFHEPRVPHLRAEVQSALFDGALYMLAYKHHIVKVVVEEESCELIKLPVFAIESKPVERIGVSEGYLHYAYHNGLLLQIWVMVVRRGRVDWELKHKTTVQALAVNSLLDHYPLVINPCYRSPSKFIPLAFDPVSEVIFLGMNSDIISYHPRTKRFTEVCDLSPQNVSLHWAWVFPFTPCWKDFFRNQSHNRQ